mmetsp:Transcript_47652/g.119981  ORF Transcript_47652/g.119981 Transcript_47652/m.119981 type:complete len:158 (+) Transcript_47652:239-712(+)|eukprot:CAMPEP_0177650946 /NCGR_PEP_ID=MMETSP0447-20121125/12244_1 /TAXON_ID=0 /ORGANISM="Stygamoeba regulata, Strain BSH-02190019" /LENGTH=157 /DNA_ID=CAMNT_0019153911 /DNA_START=176 /DNA_END=649 /DNA_ORIENTATION=+
MRCVVQRVLGASVTVDGKETARIGPGLLVLVGVASGDGRNDTEWMSRKLINMRLWTDDKGKPWNKSVKDKDLEILLVSQFTLMGYMKGNRPDFHLAMGSMSSESTYITFGKECAKKYSAKKIQSGEFGAYMNVSLINDGPVTMVLDSKHRSGRADIE